MAIKYCQNCANEVMETINICPQCGTKNFEKVLSPEPEVLSPEPEVISQEPVIDSIENVSQTEVNQNNYASPASNPYSPAAPSFVDNFISIGGGILAMFLFFGIGAIQIYAGFLGIENEFGFGWAMGCLALTFFLRISLPLTIGTFLCALNIWHWHWFGALLFTMPGLLFIIPGMISAILDSMRK